MKWGARLKFNKIAKIAAAITLFIVIVLASFTFIGANGANFVVKFEDVNGLSIAMYESEDFSKPTNRLVYPSVLDQKDVTLSWLPENIEDGLGNKSDYTGGWYFCVSFLLRNESNVNVDIGADINISKVEKKVDSAIRVALIKDGVWNIFAKPQEIGNVGQPEITADRYGNVLYESRSFISPSKVCSETYQGMKIQEAYKFTVVIWVEGNDPQCTDSIKGGKMSLDLSIKII